jgi:hypothetical protein
MLGGLVAAGASPAIAKEKPAPAATETHGNGPSRPGDVVGRYAILRAGKDTGCMLTLEPARAQLAPACRDNGIVVFDPKGWSLASGKLMLRARKGHSTVFDMSEGVWVKDAKEGGQPLGLRKMPN